MHFSTFAKLVGAAKFEELQSISSNGFLTSSEDFQILHKIYQSFCTIECKTDNLRRRDDSDDRQDFDMTASIHTENISQNMALKTTFTEEEILNMPLVLCSKEDETNLNENISNYYCGKGLQKGQVSETLKECHMK